MINCVVLAMVLLAAVRIAEVFLPWHQWLAPGLYAPLVEWIGRSGLQLGGSIGQLPPAVASANNLISILLIVCFTALYSVTGGLRAVVRTDVLQFGLAMLGTLVYASFVLDAAGGLQGLTERIQVLYGEAEARRMLSFAPPADAGEALAPFLLLIGLQWLFQMNSDGTGYLAQRSMACPSDREARIAGLLFTWLQILLRSTTQPLKRFNLIAYSY